MRSPCLTKETIELQAPGIKRRRVNAAEKMCIRGSELYNTRNGKLLYRDMPGLKNRTDLLLLGYSNTRCYSLKAYSTGSPDTEDEAPPAPSYAFDY